MKILITGGSGFIGTNLVKDLIKQGHNVRIFDKNPSRAFPDLLIPGDVRDREALHEAASGMDCIYHLAAEHHDNVRPKSLYYDVNVGGAENLISACEKHCINRLIFTSTVALYGLNAGTPSESSPANPFNDYGKSKYEAEIIFRKWADADPKRSLTILRPTVIFGEKNRGNVYNLLHQIASGKFLMVGNGENKKSLGYVRNISAFMTTLTDTAPGTRIYNFADKPDFTMSEFYRLTTEALPNCRKSKGRFRLPYSVGLAGGYAFDLLSKLSGKNFPISSVRIKKFCANTQIDTTRLTETGFTPPYSLEEGIKRTIKHEFV